jgi:hypothetical protein
MHGLTCGFMLKDLVASSEEAAVPVTLMHFISWQHLPPLEEGSPQAKELQLRFHRPNLASQRHFPFVIFVEELENVTDQGKLPPTHASLHRNCTALNNSTPPAPDAIHEAVLVAVDNASDGAAAAPKHQPAHSTAEHSPLVCACIYKATFAEDISHYFAIGLNSRQVRSIERGKLVKLGVLAHIDAARL